MNKMAKRAIVLAIMLAALIVLPVAAMAEVEVTPSNISGMTFDQNETYKFVGDFTQELDIKATAGKQMTFDGSNATFKGHIKFSFGQIIDNTASFANEKTGSYVIDGFKTDDSISIGGGSVESITIQNSNAKALDLNISNSNAVVKNNIIENDGSYKRYDGGSNKYGLYVYSDNYNLDVLNNTITSKDTVICVLGNYEQFQINNPVTLKNSLNIKNNVLASENKLIFKTYNDVTYAPVEWPNDYRVTTEMQALADQILGQNTLKNACKNGVINVLLRANGKEDMQASEENLFADIAEKYADLLHPAGSPVVENEVAATVTTEGSYELVTYCSECSEVLERKIITVPKLPAPTPAPEATPVPDTSDMPQTGDNSNIALFAALLTMSAAGMLLLMRRRSAQR